jgi:hypothetical protein
VLWIRIRIRNLRLWIRIRIRKRRCLIKNHQKNKHFDNYDIKKRKSNIFFKKDALKCHENVFYYWHCERKNIYSRIRNWIRNFLVVKEDPNPDPKLRRKWDPNPDPKKIVSDPQHCLLYSSQCSHHMTTLARALTIWLPGTGTSTLFFKLIVKKWSLLNFSYLKKKLFSMLQTKIRHPNPDSTKFLS